MQNMHYCKGVTKYKEVLTMEASNVRGSLALRGIIAVLFGVAAVFWPHLTLVSLVYLFSAFILINGVIDLVSGIGRLSSDNTDFVSRLLVLLLGLLQIGVGVYLIRHPHVSFSVLILLIGFTLIVRGIFEVVAGLFESNTSLYKTLAVISGLIAVVAGVVILFQPVAAGVAFVWILGLYALITGPMFIALAMDVHKNEQLAANRKK